MKGIGSESSCITIYILYYNEIKRMVRDRHAGIPNLIRRKMRKKGGRNKRKQERRENIHD